MICEKVFTCSAVDPDSIVLELAREIMRGWTISHIELLDLTVSKEVQPCCKITLRRKGQ